MTDNIKKKANAFLKEHRLRQVTLDGLRSAIQKQGYTVIEFNGICDEENVAALLSALELEDFCRKSNGFVYADEKRRLVFLREDLSEKEKLIVLAHEAGHIYCNHLASAHIIGRDVREEYEANEFAHYLLHRSKWQKFVCTAREQKKACIAAAVAIVLLTVGCFVFYGIRCENTYYGAYYITTTGNKYHKKDCGYVKGKNNVERLTREQYESGKYTPCDSCIPEGEK